jgi:hypothetical protein
MQNDDLFLCSELIRLAAGRTAVIGTLVLISPVECTVTVDAPLPAKTPVRMHCLACPLGKKSCSECRFKGKVVNHEMDPTLGCMLRIEFENRMWSRDEWRPRHLTELKLLHPAEGGEGR